MGRPARDAAGHALGLRCQSTDFLSIAGKAALGTSACKKQSSEVEVTSGSFELNLTNQRVPAPGDMMGVLGST